MLFSKYRENKRKAAAEAPGPRPQSKRNRIISLALLFWFLMSTAGCEVLSSREDAEAKAEGREFIALLRLLSVASGSRPPGTGPGSTTGELQNARYEDMGDGTIKRTQMYEACDSNDNCTETHAYPVIYIHKCMHGQVFRPAQNDCRGTGTAGDLYGATQLQFCPTDDESCEDADHYATAASPAYQVCNNLATAGYSWTLPIISAEEHPDAVEDPNLSNSYPEKILSDEVLNNMMPDSPQGFGEGVWHRVMRNGWGTQMHLAPGTLDTAYLSTQLKTEDAYVMCISVQGGP